MNPGDAGYEPPDLNAIPTEQWKDVLRPLPEYLRRRAKGGIQNRHLLGHAATVLIELEWEDQDRKAKFRVPTLPEPAGVKARVQSRQVNFRITVDQFADLEKVAADVGLKRSQLARQLVLRGLDLALREARGGVGPLAVVEAKNR